MNVKYLPGLDSLRFLAAFFVIISHGAISLNKLGINDSLIQIPLFNRGGAAVEFFFTLSGFLITYLLIKEFDKNKEISLRAFYKRRILRIWPLYFIILILGFVFLGYLYPKFKGETYFEFSNLNGILLYLFFLSNFAIIYKVGFLYPLWSISVEEQFYLFWAPLVKLFKYRIKMLILVFILITFTFSLFVTLGIFDFGVYHKFFVTLKFSNMAIGSLFGYILFYKFEKYNSSFFTNKFVQIFVTSFIVCFYFFGFKFLNYNYISIFMPFFYGLLILNVSVISKKLFTLNNSITSYLGKISYGLYMYHMLIDYTLRFSIDYFNLVREGIVFQILYFILLISLTILTSALSYKYVEHYFLSLKNTKIYVRKYFSKSTPNQRS